MDSFELTPEQKQTLFDAARRCVEIEQSAVGELLNSLDDDFQRCVEAMYRCTGRVVLTGIGKSALIGQKIAATLNSTGTPALFMHAADAIHGDLGMIRREDIVWCISKSGETEEIKVLIPLIRNFGCMLVGMVSNKASTLAQRADCVLHTPIPQEGDPNNLAPTASTTAQVAMGDAVAVALLALRGFSPQDFAQFHPGGSLGKQLYLRVSHIYPMHGRPLVTSGAGLREIIIEMTGNRLGMTAVADENGHLAGIITDGDLRRMLHRTEGIDLLRASDIMTVDPKTVEADALAVDAFRLMRENNITQVLVVENGAYAGVIHLHDLLREGIL
ncbi:MAG: Arabinose 5-phosphate isomerase KdsD [Saprospiraceae bacterium]|nr:Arabinose 5-phosphate isomerase KdsD [Saprospiraceae bacterium]